MITALAGEVAGRILIEFRRTACADRIGRVTNVRVEIADRGRYISEAATIWAEATAARDNDPEIAPLSEALPIIQRVIDSSPRSLLLVALTSDDRPAGFAAIEPSPTDGGTAHIRYLGVRPGGWGAGVGRSLMRSVPTLLPGAGFTAGELEVYLDNDRAVKLYESFHWLPAGAPTPHPRSGRLEQRYRLDW